MFGEKNTAIAIIAIVLLSSVSLYVWMNNDEDDEMKELSLENFGLSSDFTLSDLNEDNKNVEYVDNSQSSSSKRR